MARKKKDIEVVDKIEVVLESVQDTTENVDLETDTEVVLNDVDETVVVEQTEDEVETEENSDTEIPWYVAKALRDRDYYN